MNWFIKTASDEARLANNIERLEELRQQVHDLAYFGTASGSGGYVALQRLLARKVVLGRPVVEKKLKEALIGENNQKIAIDAPTRFQKILLEAESLVQFEIGKEEKVLRGLIGS